MIISPNENADRFEFVPSIYTILFDRTDGNVHFESHKAQTPNTHKSISKSLGCKRVIEMLACLYLSFVLVSFIEQAHTRSRQSLSEQNRLRFRLWTLCLLIVPILAFFFFLFIWMSFPLHWISTNVMMQRKTMQLSGSEKKTKSNRFQYVPNSDSIFTIYLRSETIQAHIQDSSNN